MSKSASTLLSLLITSFMLPVDLKAEATASAPITATIVPPMTEVSIKGVTTLNRAAPDTLKADNSVVLRASGSGGAAKLIIDNSKHLTYSTTVLTSVRFIDKTGRDMRIESVRIQPGGQPIEDGEYALHLQGVLIDGDGQEGSPVKGGDSINIILNFN